MKAKLAVLLTLAALSHADAAGLNGVARSAFIANRADLIVQWRAVCACTAERTADRLTVAEAMKDNDSEKKTQMLADLAKACMVDVLTFKPSSR